MSKKIGKGNYLLWRHRKKLTTNMKRTIYESFVRCHLTYWLSTWGAKKSAENTVLTKQVKKIWSKMGNRFQHTNERLTLNTRRVKVSRNENHLEMGKT